MSYLFSFKGRINRAKIWLFLLITIVAYIVIGVIAGVGLDWSEFAKSFIAQAKELTPGEQLDFSKLACPKMIGPQSYVALAAMGVLFLALLYAGLAIFVKRLHDRNKSAWWLIPYWLVPVGLQAFAKVDAHSFFATFATMSLLDRIAYGLALLISLWVFIELYFFRGTRGENRYGPDPLA